MGTAQLVFVGVLCGCVGSDRVRMRDRKLHHRKLHHRAFLTRISRVFPGSPLDSGYEQWNCESNLYRVTIDLC